MFLCGFGLFELPKTTQEYTIFAISLRKKVGQCKLGQSNMPELIVRGQFVYKEYIPLSFTIHFQNGTLFLSFTSQRSPYSGHPFRKVFTF